MEPVEGIALPDNLHSRLPSKDVSILTTHTTSRRGFLRMAAKAVMAGVVSSQLPRVAFSQGASVNLPPLPHAIEPNTGISMNSVARAPEEKSKRVSFKTFAELGIQREYPSPYGYVMPVFDTDGKMNFPGKYPYKEYVSRKISSEGLPFYSPSERSPEALSELARIFNSPDNLRYTPDDHTWCNFFVQDVTEACGVELPHYYKGREQVANNIYQCLAEKKDYGADWNEITEREARESANRGRVVVGTIYNKQPGRSGHVFIGMPTPDESDHIYAAQAGRRNFIGERYEVEKYSNRNIYSETRFFIHNSDVPQSESASS